jgi:hypothetical protein
MSQPGLYRAAVAGALALALGACGGGATPTPAPTSAPTPAPTATPGPTPAPTTAAADVAKVFLARMLAARTGVLAMTGSIAVGTVEVPLTGTLTINGGDSQSIITIETPGASQTQESIRVGTQQWNRSAGGPWVLNPTPNDRTKSLSAFLQALTALEDRGVATHKGQQLVRLVPPASETMSAEALGFNSPGVRDAKVTMEFWAKDDGTPAAWSFNVAWSQASGTTTVAARLVMDLDLGRLGEPTTVAAPGNAWERFVSARFGYSMAHPAGWTVNEAEGQDSYLVDGTPHVTVSRSSMAGFTLERYVKEVLALYDEQLGAKPERNEEIALGGQPARFITYHFKNDKGAQLYAAEALSMNGDVGWDVLLTEQAGSEADDTPVFEAMLSTFGFTD